MTAPRFLSPRRPFARPAAHPVPAHHVPAHRVPAHRVPALLVAVLVLVASGCASTRRAASDADGAVPLIADFGRHSLADVVARLDAADSLAGVRGSGRLLVTSPQQNGSFDMDLRGARDGRFYLTVSALGIEGARALVRPDSVFLYTRIETELTLGPADKATALLPFPLDGPAGFRLLTGTLRPDPATGYTMEANRSKGHYLLRSADGRSIVAVDPALWRIVRAVRYDASGALAEEILIDRYDAAEAVPLPGRISIRRPADRLAATLLFERLAPSQDPDVPAELRVPTGTRRRAL